jgi:hypothetical protein
MFVFRRVHDKIRAEWASNIPSKNMLEMVWWCKHSKINFLNQIIYCPMNCSNRRKHTRLKAVENHMLPWNVLLKKKCYGLVLKFQEGRGCWSSIKLTTMIKTTTSQFLKYVVGTMVIRIWTPYHQKLLEKRLVYWLEVFLNYQKKLNTKNTQTLEGERS